MLRFLFDLQLFPHYLGSVIISFAYSKQKVKTGKCSKREIREVNIASILDMTK